MYEYELGALPEFEEEFEYEGEGEEEFETEGEGEEFLGRLAGLARQAIQSPALRRVGLAAARSALGGLGGIGEAIGGGQGTRGGAIGAGLGGALGSYLGGRLPQQEYEGEFEWEFETDGEMNPQQRIYPSALMEHLGHAAATAESEAEAEAFLGAMIPIAARLLPRVAPTVMRVAPTLIRGVAGAGRTLLRSPTFRPLVRAMPTVVRGTVANIARQVAQGRPITAQTALRTLAGQTARVLSNPQRAALALRRCRALDRQYHQVRAARARCMRRY
jgi:hypothetical protein